jgi:hypothetical protein
MVKTGKKYFCLGQLLPSSVLVLFRNPQEAPASTTIPLTRAGSRFGAAPFFFPGEGRWKIQAIGRLPDVPSREIIAYD